MTIIDFPGQFRESDCPKDRVKVNEQDLRPALPSELSIPPHEWGFPYELSQEAIEALTDPKQRFIFGRLLRTHRALLAMQRRHASENVERLNHEIAKCEVVLRLLDPDPHNDI